MLFNSYVAVSLIEQIGLVTVTVLTRNISEQVKHIPGEELNPTRWGYPKLTVTDLTEQY